MILERLFVADVQLTCTWRSAVDLNWSRNYPSALEFDGGMCIVARYCQRPWCTWMRSGSQESNAAECIGIALNQESKIEVDDARGWVERGDRQRVHLALATAFIVSFTALAFTSGVVHQR